MKTINAKPQNAHAHNPMIVNVVHSMTALKDTQSEGRPGALNAQSMPSRNGDFLTWPDGTVTTLDNKTAAVSVTEYTMPTFYKPLVKQKTQFYKQHTIKNGGMCKPLPIRGEIVHSSAKLTSNQVREIRKLHVAGIGNSELGRRFNVHPSTIYAIVRMETWKDVV